MIPIKISILLVFIASVAILEAHAEDYQLTVKANPNIIFISGSGSYAEGTEVVLDSAPDNFRDYSFQGWKIDGRWSDENPLTIRMDRSHSVEAIYEKTSVSGGILVDTIPRISEITIDGTIYLPSELPQIFSWETGSEHVVSVQNIVSAGTDTRYIFDSWKDQNTESLRTIVAEEDTDYIALFKTQHYLKPITEHGNVVGGGWVDDDTIVDFEIESDIVYDKKDENIRYVFNSWNKGDYLNSELNSISITDPETVRANWDTQYQLQIVSNIPDYSLFGSGWYSIGKKVALIAEDELDSPNSNIKYKFDRWVSKGVNPVIVPNSHSSSTTITVNEPYLIEAHYKKSYRVNVWTPFGSANGAGFHSEGSSVSISLASNEIVVDPNKVRKVFTGWDTSEARVLGGLDSKSSPKSGTLAQIKGEMATSKNQNLLILADRPTNVSANWKTQYYLDVKSQEGGTQGGGWYDVGRSAQISVKSISTSPGMWTANTFQGWSGDVDSNNLKERVIMDAPKSVVAEWQVDNTPGIVNSFILGGIAVIGLVIYKKTHKTPTFGNINKKGSGPNETKPFDMYFNTKTQSKTKVQNSSPFAKNDNKLSSIVSWLLGRK